MNKKYVEMVKYQRGLYIAQTFCHDADKYLEATIDTLRS